MIRQEAKAAKLDEAALQSYRSLRLNMGVPDSVASCLLEASTWERAEALPTPAAPRDRGPIPMGNGGSVTKRTLADALQAAAEPKPAAKTIPSRRGKRALVTYLDPDTSRRLKAAAAMSDRSMQSLGVEAAELLIERYGTR